MTSALLPINATPGERATDSATARVAAVPTPVTDLWSPQTCPESLLPWLAWALSLDSWQSYWPIEVKRARVASAIAIQRHKGTAKSIRDVTAAYGGAVSVKEWWEQSPPGDPYTFAMTLTLSGKDGEQATAQYVDDVIADIERTMPVRCHYTFTQGFALSARIGVAVAVRPYLYQRLSMTSEAAA